MGKKKTVKDWLGMNQKHPVGKAISEHNKALRDALRQSGGSSGKKPKGKGK
jgi:hypothetical protein